MSEKLNATQSTFTKSAEGLANMLAVAAAFFGTAPLYTNTVDWVVGFAARHYASGLDELVAFCWFITCAVTIFFTARMTIGTAITMGAMAVAARFL